MSEAAQVTSIDSLKDFYESLINFCEEAKDALGDVDMKTRRAVDFWLPDQYNYWKRQVLVRQDDLAQAKADLFRKQLQRLTGDKPDCIEEKEAVWEAEERLREAEEKVANCQMWSRQLPRAVEEYIGPARQLASMVDVDPPPSAMFIRRVIENLEAYLAVMAPETAPMAAAGITSAALPSSAAMPAAPAAPTPAAPPAPPVPAPEAPAQVPEQAAVPTPSA